MNCKVWIYDLVDILKGVLIYVVWDVLGNVG